MRAEKLAGKSKTEGKGEDKLLSDSTFAGERMCAEKLAGKSKTEGKGEDKLLSDSKPGKITESRKI